MSFILYVSEYMIPLVFFYIVAHAVFNRENAYESFIEGTKQGIKTVISIMPTLISLMVGVGILRASGFLLAFSELIGKFTTKIGLPSEIVPLLIVKMFSSSAATGLLLDIYKECGTDSLSGLIASLSMSCTETIFYTMSVLFIAAKVKKTRWTLPGALIATLAGTVASVIIAHMML